MRKSFANRLTAGLVFFALLWAATPLGFGSPPNEEKDSFSMFGLKVGMKASEARALAEKMTLSLKKDAPHHQSYEGPLDSNPDIALRIMIAFAGGRLYDINIDLMSGSRELLDVYALEGRDTAEKTSAPAARGEIFEGFHWHQGDIFYKDDLFVSIGAYEDIHGQPVVSIKYRRQQDFLRYEIRDQYRFELQGEGWRVAERSPVERMPETVNGERVYRSAKEAVPPRPIVGPAPVYRSENGYAALVALIDAEGNVRDIPWIRATSPAIQAVARRAVFEAKYRPAAREGIAVPFYLHVIFNFRKDSGRIP
jgi:hypothetical protein